MLLASCSNTKEICMNRQAYQTADGHGAELRHGTYFRLHGNKVLQFRFASSATWLCGSDCRIKGDTIYMYSPNVESKFYNYAEN